MYLPQFKGAGRKAQKQAVQFGGVNYTQAYQDGELSQADGISSRMWPCLTTRAGRTPVQPLDQGEDLYAWGELVAVDGTSLLYGGDVVGTVTPGKKQMAVVGTKLCIFPDKKCLDLTTREMGDLQATVENATRGEAMVRFTERAVMLQGPETVLGRYTFRHKEYGAVNCVDAFKFRVFQPDSLSWDPDNGWELGEYVEKKAPDLVVGDCILLGWSQDRLDRDPDYSFNGGGYAEQYDQWGDFVRVCEGVEWQGSAVSESYIKIPLERCNAGKLIPSLEGIFFPGDRVSVSGCTAQEGNNRTALQVESVEGRTVTFVLSENSHFTPGTETGAVKLCRDVPDLDFICESGGRLWGVCNKDGHIYASRGGDPANFYAYIEASGATTDCSWSIPVGTDGAWTGCVAYGSNVLCWKENTLHKVLGTHAANYEIFSYQITGVQAGCEKSLQIVNEVLYYKGRDGVYAYTGGSPRRISGKLGLVDYGKAVAGQDGRNYIISMERADTGAWETLSYGIETGLWMVEDQREAAAFANLDGTLYLLQGGRIYRQEGETDEGEGVEWSVTFTPFAEMIHNKKGLSRLLLYLELDPGAWLEVDTAADQGPFVTVWTAKEGDGQALVVPIRPGRCNRFQVRLRGKGRFVLRSMVREFSMGGNWR